MNKIKNFFQKRVYKLLILILIVNISSLARENLTKNKSREKYLNDLKKEQLIIGIVKNDDFKVKNKLGVSIVDLVKEMFLKELKLDVLFIEEDQEKLEVMLKEQKIEGIALINKENEISNQLSLTNILFTKNIYLVSSDIPLNSLNDLRVLNKPKVYFEKGDYKYRIFKEKMKVNDMDIDFYEVDDIKNYQNELILTTQFNKYEFKNKLQVTISPGYIIGLDKKYSKLADVLSEVLSRKYRQKFNLLLEEINKEMSLEYFLSSLTDDEKKYIDNLKKLRISYEENSLEDIYYYSKYYKKSKGLIPMLIERIIEALKINLVVYEDKKEKKLELLEKGEIDFLILSKTMDRDKKYLFSEKIADLNTYVISKKDKSSFRRRVGVLRYNIEEEIVKNYDISRNIKSYSNYELLKKALDDKEIEYILTINKDGFELAEYDIRIFEKVPINLAFNLNNPLLKSIVDKALIHLIDIEILKKETYLDIEREKEADEKIKENEKRVLIFLLLLAGGYLFYLYDNLKRKHKENETLLKDSLTGLLSREKFNEFLKEKKYSVNGFVFVIDLNNFKNVNDTKGHNFGDKIIIEFANFLKTLWRDEKIFRISGDEYYGFLEKETEVEIIDKLKKYKEYCPLMQKNNVSFTLGLNNIKNGDSLKEGFKYADLIMLENKGEGKFKYGIVNDEFIYRKNREVKILNELKIRLEHFYPVYQPKFCLKSNRIIGAEALARFYSKELGPIYPNEFIKIAEENGVVYKIDYIIAEKTMIYLKKKIDKEELPQDFKISFNLSVQTFEREDIIAVLMNLLKNSGIKAQNLEIEITESVFTVKLDELVMKLRELKKLGFTISLDDFTAGHSGATILSLLPIDIVKFDKSLLDSIESTDYSKRAKNIYKRLVGLMKEIDLKIVSEGVETSKQLQYLNSLGVEYIQGYFISKPISGDEMSLIIKRNGGNI